MTADATALARLVPANAPTDATGKAKAFITSFGQRAFRRPLTDAEVTTHVALFNQGPTLYPGVDTFKAGVSLVIQAMLQSPHFLYRTELGTAAAGATKVAAQRLGGRRQARALDHQHHARRHAVRRRRRRAAP